MIPRFWPAVIVLLGLFLPAAAHAVPASQVPRKVVVVVANRVLLEDLVDPALPSLTALMRDAAVGLVSPNCAGFKSEPSIMLTAASGIACRGGAFVRECYDADEAVFEHSRAADEYAARTGFEAGRGSAVFLGLGQALRANADLPAPAKLGAIGDALREAGARSCVIGSADIRPGRIDRSAAVLAMDSAGLADVGRLRWGSDAAGLCPAGAAVPDPEALAAAVRNALGAADLVVVDFGCTRSLDELQMSFSEDAYAAQRANALRALDALVGKLGSDARRGRFALILVSLSPPASDYGKRLTPIVILGGGAPGLLSSPTTRTPGLIAASDFAPTVISMVGVPAAGALLGRPAAASPGSGEPLRALRDLDRRSAAHRRLVAPVLWVFTVVGAVALGGAAVVLSFPGTRRRRIVVAVRGALLLISVAPVSMLLAVLAPAGAVWYALACAGWLVALWVVLHIFWRRDAVVAAFALTSAVVLLDSALGGDLCKLALPSSYQLSGLRYYGIGNEYAGVLISMSALAVVFRAAGRPAGWLWAAAVGALVTAFLAIGALGANYGGAVASAVTFGLLVAAMRAGRFGARHAAAFAALGAVLVLMMAALEARVAGAAGSHAGRLAGIAEATGGAQLAALVARKVLLNLRLAASESAVRAHMVFLPFIVLWFIRVRAIMHYRFGSEARLVAGLKSVAVGAGAAALLNDSGIVMAAIMLAMAAIVISYSMLESLSPGGVGAGEGGECLES